MRSFALCLATMLVGVGAQTASAAEEFLMNIPGISGDVTQAGYTSWISVTSFSEGFSNTARNSAVFGGGGASRSSCQELHIVKPLDVTSPSLAMAVATGHRYSKVVLVALVTSADARPAEFLRFTLQNVLVSSVVFGGDSSSSARTETLALRPESIEVTYSPQRADGGSGTPVSAVVDCLNGF